MNKISKIEDSYIVIVDPHFKNLTKALLIHDFKLIAVLSDLKAVEGGAESTNSGQVYLDFTHVLSIKKGIDEVMNTLKQHNIVGVVNGDDTGTQLCIEISNKLKLTNCNDSYTQDFLRDKYLTGQHIRSRNIPTANQYLITKNNLELALSSIKSKIRFPLVIKPVNSAGSQGVNICHNQLEAQSSIEKLFNSKNVFGERITQILAEEMLSGQEFAVCTVSTDGYHAITGVLAYVYDEKSSKNFPFPRYVKIASYEDPTVKKVVQYTKQVLDACDFRYGQATVEVINTANGPRLVELNPRVAGVSGLIDELFMDCINRSQVKMTAEAFKTSRDGIKKKYPEAYALQQHGRIVILKNILSGKITAYKGIEEIKKLDSFRDLIINNKIGDVITPSTEVMTFACMVLITNKDSNQLKQDFEYLLKLEEEGLFLVS